MSVVGSCGDGPISGLCIVADHTRAPPGYTVIKKTYDDPTKDADLHRDGIFKRIDRYMCITRYPFPNIVEDIILITTNSNPPSLYTPLQLTVDTNENATSKKVICVRMSPRQKVSKAVGDIIFLCRQRRPPPGYTLLGELNGLMMCYSEWTVDNEPANRCSGITNEPAISESAEKMSNCHLDDKSKQQRGRALESPRTAGNNSIREHLRSLYPAKEVELMSNQYSCNFNRPMPREPLDKPTALDVSFDTIAAQRSDDFGWSIISHIPFQFKRMQNATSKQGELLTNEMSTITEADKPQMVLPTMNFLNSVNIDTRYNYDFVLEKAWISVN